MRPVITVAEVVGVLDALYPRSTRASWDAVGPVCGHPGAEVHLVGYAIDPTAEVVDEAIARGADLLVTHHPLYLRGTSTVYADSAKGALVHRLIESGCALVVAHTNADIARHGVSEALAAALGLVDAEPLVPDDRGALGPDELGSGRIGRLAQPMTLRDFAAHASRSLPSTPAGIRVGGDLDRVVRVVAVSGGAGDAYLDAATSAGADAYVTADLRHHYATEHLAGGGPALLDVGHWASEWPWLPVVAQVVADRLARLDGGDTVGSYVSAIVTDPWTLHLAR